MLEKIADAFFALDEERCFTYLSPEAERLLGKSNKDLLGQSVGMIFSETSGFHREYSGAAEVKAVGFEEYHAPLGTWFEVKVYPFEGGLSVYFRDVPERQETEEKLREAEERYRTLVERVPPAIYVQAPEPSEPATYEVRYMSPRVAEILGYHPSRFEDDPGFWNRIILPEDLGRVAAEEERTDETGEPFEIEYRMIHRDGRIVWVRDEAALIRGEGGRPLYWQGVLSDITERKRFEEALEASETRFRSVVEGVGEGLLITDPDDVVLYANPRMEALTGYSADELLGRTGYELLLPPGRWREAVERNRRRAVGVVERYETPLLRKDGTEFWAAVHATPYRDASGRIVGTLGAIADVTERRRADQRLEESEERYRSLYEHNPDAVYSLDLEGNYLNANPACEEVSGYSVEEFLRKSFELFVIPEDLEKTKRHFEAAVAGEPQNYEIAIRHKLGHRVELNVTNVPIVVAGQVVGVYGIAKDVTGRKREEEARSRLAAIVESSDDAIISRTLDGVITSWNRGAEKLYGYSAEEAVGKPNSFLYPPDHPQEMPEILEKIRRGESVDHYETVRVRKDGRRVHVSLNVSPIKDAAGNVVGDSGIARDVTERKEAEEALKESEGRHRSQARELYLLHQVRTALARELDPRAVCRSVVEAVAETYGYALVSAYLIEGGSGAGDLILQHQIGYETVLERIPAARGVMWRAVRAGRPVLLKDARSDPDFLNAIEGIVSEVCVPLFDGDEVIGTLNVESTGGVELTRADLRLLEAVGEHAGTTLGRARLHARVREAEERYRALVENIPAVVYMDDVDETNSAIYMSPYVREVLGYEPEEFFNSPEFWHDLLHPEDRERVLVENGRTNQTGEPFRIEYRMIRKDGAVVWVRDEAVLIRDEQGRPKFWQGYFADVTDRRLAEDRLREAEARYRTMVEGVPAITYVHTQKPGGTSHTAYVSPQIEAVLGYTPEEYASDPEFWTTVLHPEDRARVLAEDARTGETGEPFEIEFRMVAKDDRTVWLREEGRRVRRDNGVQIWHGVMFDITELKRTEMALRESEEQYRRLVETVQEGIAFVDAEEKIAYSNPAYAAIFGLPPEELFGRSLLEFLDDEGRRKAAEQTALREGGESSSYELSIIAADGRKKILSASGSPITDADGNFEGAVHAIVDVTERKEAEEALRESEERFRALVQNASDMISILNPDGTMRYVSPSVERVLGYRPEERVGMNAFGGETHPDDAGKLWDVFAEGLGRPGGVSPPLEFRVRHRDGSWRHLEAVATNRVDHAAVGGIVVNARDVTERKAYEERLAHQATHDPLTGLPNRRLLTDRLGQALARTARRRGRVAVLYLDLDNFKVVNDSLGHEVGDRLLVAVARRLKDYLRPEDTVARLGGDEFVVLLEEADLEGAVKAAERIAESLSTPFALDGRTEAFVTTSIGIALGGPADAKDPGDLLREADLAMYRAKRNGKAAHVIFEPSMDVEARERLSLENDLRRAFERRQLRLHYQPIVEIETGRVVGAEALLRWEHPERGLLAPKHFIPLAEETGLIVPLGLWILEEACRQTAEWREGPGGVSPGDYFRVSVNVSSRQLREPDFVADVVRTIRQVGFPPEALTLELTEGDLIGETDVDLRALDELKDVGITLALDDFGTGYSSLSYLGRLPVDSLKLDRSIVAGVEENRANAAIVSAAVVLAGAMGLEVVAEGVETEGERAKLLSLGCALGQGNYWREPGPAEAMVKLDFGAPLAEG